MPLEGGSLRLPKMQSKRRWTKGSLTSLRLFCNILFWFIAFCCCELCESAPPYSASYSDIMNSVYALEQVLVLWLRV